MRISDCSSDVCSSDLVHEIKAEALDLMVDRAGDDVARRKLSPRIEIGHEATAIGRPLQNRTFAAHRLGDEEVLDLGVIETGRVKLVELHVRHAAPGAPGDRKSVV